jgi:hypothetical protein
MDLHGGTMANPGSEQVILLLRSDSLALLREYAKKKELTLSKTVQLVVDNFFFDNKCDTF